MLYLHSSTDQACAGRRRSDGGSRTAILSVNLPRPRGGGVDGLHLETPCTAEMRYLTDSAGRPAKVSSLAQGSLGFDVRVERAAKEALVGRQPSVRRGQQERGGSRCRSRASGRCGALCRFGRGGRWVYALLSRLARARNAARSSGRNVLRARKACPRHTWLTTLLIWIVYRAVSLSQEGPDWYAGSAPSARPFPSATPLPTVAPSAPYCGSGNLSPSAHRNAPRA